MTQTSNFTIVFSSVSLEGTYISANKSTNMLDQAFCVFLEYEITRVFGQSDDVLLKHFWCDGVLLPDSEEDYSKKHVNIKRQVVMLAYSGQTGNDQYELTLRFGPKALSRYSRDLSIKECVPGVDVSNWLQVDIERKKIVVQLK